MPKAQKTLLKDLTRAWFNRLQGDDTKVNSIVFQISTPDILAYCVSATGATDRTGGSQLLLKKARDSR